MHLLSIPISIPSKLPSFQKKAVGVARTIPFLHHGSSRLVAIEAIQKISLPSGKHTKSY
jgi:hypothetical protein